MGEINQALGVAGAGVTLKIGASEYPLSPLTKRIQGQYEAWLESRAKESLRSERDFLGADGYAAALKGVTDDILGGKYSFTGSLAQATMQTVDGVTYLLYLLLRPATPKVTIEDAARFMEEAAAEVAAAIRELSDLGKRQRSTPQATN